MAILKVLKAVTVALVVALPFPAFAGQTNVAVAANFTDAAKEIVAAFKTETGHDVALSFGSTGQLYTQITQDAPFEVFLAADTERPEKAVTDGLAKAENKFTYAIGKIVLWSKDAALVKDGTARRCRPGASRRSRSLTPRPPPTARRRSRR